MASQVKRIAETLRKQCRPAIRVTQHSLLRRLDHRVYHKVEHRYPQTAQAIAAELDDDLQYYRRRMLDLQTNLQDDGQRVTSQLLLQAVPRSKRTSALLKVASQLVNSSC